MLSNKIKGFIILMFILAQALVAKETGHLQKYFNEAAIKVKATDEPQQKRAILNNSLETMSKALTRVEKSGMITKEDRVIIERINASLQEKQNELMGNKGAQGVPDAQLNAFSDYVVQDMEQADQVITISVVTLLLIVLIIVLLV
jgi:hypothetical protein